MRSISSARTGALFMLLACAAASALAMDTFDGTYLHIPKVQVGGTTYGNVLVRPAGVVSVAFDRSRSNFPANYASAANFDTYDSGAHQLFVPTVQAYGTVYENVMLTIGEISFVGGAFGANLGTKQSAYASPQGSDLNAGTIDHPFRTAQMCASSLAPGGTCYLRQGTYEETVTPNSNTTISSYGGEVATIDGSSPLPSNGWTPYSGSIWRIPAGPFPPDLAQVFVDDQAMTQARWPNTDDLFHPEFATAKPGTTTSNLVDGSMPAANLAGGRIRWWSGSDPWNPQTGVITFSSAGNAPFTLDGASFRDYIVPQAGGYYYLFDHLSLLDREREWFYDANANLLYFWAPGGVNPATLNVRVKQRQHAFDLTGLANVTLRNITVIGSDIVTDPNSSGITIDTIKAKWLNHFSTLPDMPACPWPACSTYPSSYWYNHVDDSGIVLNGTGNTLKNSEIAYTAGNGVTVLGTNNRVTNNLIHHVAYSATNTAAVAVQGTHHSIDHNTIHSVPRTAIFPSTTNYYPQIAPNDIDISYNNIYNCMLVSRDDGCIYAGGQPGVTGTVIHHNWIHDSGNSYPGPASDFATTGVYFDEDASGWVAIQNVIWNNAHMNVFIHGNGPVPLDITVSNNTIPDANADGMIRLSEVQACGTTQVTNNLVLVTPQQMSPATCNVSNNGPTAAGATEMAGVVPGCNFAGCSSNSPPSVVGGHLAASRRPGRQ